MAIAAGVAIILVRVFHVSFRGIEVRQASRISEPSHDLAGLGPYRALAELAYAASQKMERTWDKAEDNGGDTAFSKKNRAAFEDIDKAMDQFVELLKGGSSAPDPAAIKNAFNSYMDK